MIPSFSRRSLAELTGTETIATRRGDFVSGLARKAEMVAAIFKGRRTGSGRWMAHCPAHNDSSASLSIREDRKGRVLVHCFAGCHIEAVVSAVGLRTSDLFFNSGPTSESIQTVRQDRDQREREHDALRAEYRRLVDHYWKVDHVVEEAILLVSSDSYPPNLPKLLHRGFVQIRLFEERMDSLNGIFLERR